MGVGNVEETRVRVRWMRHNGVKRIRQCKLRQMRLESVRWDEGNKLKQLKKFFQLFSGKYFSAVVSSIV